jgi:protein-S-isoprenylcysteine O-methyltransferase Ste14
MLIISLYLVTSGVLLLRKARKPGVVRTDENLYRFERTTELVTAGIYKHIRHPLYSSLLFLSWGIWFKQPGLITAMLALLTSILLYLTSKADEEECVAFFGENYSDYMRRTKRFIPFIF